MPEMLPETSLSTATLRPRLWAFAAIAGLIAGTLLYDSAIGINLVIWAAAAAVGLLTTQSPRGRMRRTMLVPVAFALVLAAGAAITADGSTQALGIALVASLLALATVLAAAAPARSAYGAMLILTAPIAALLATARCGLRTVIESIGSIRALHRRPVLRGALVGAVVALVFAALFADADPLFARGRDAVASLLDFGDLAPRLLFMAAMTFGVLGAYAYAASGDPGARSVVGGGAPVRIASRATTAERTIVLACAAAVSWLFVSLQIAYVASDAPARAGSGVTYAQYAHRGFGQLSVVATLAVLLVVATLGGGRGASAARSTRGAALALLVAVAGVLVSAFHRVTLYENVYGFTTARVEAQAYMLVVLVVLALCATEVARGFDAARLARATMVSALVAVATITVWNDQAWVVRKDVARFAGTARLDVGYLTRQLSPDAYPALLEALPALPATQREQLAIALWPRATCELRGGTRWFEWNLSRVRARAALRSHGFPLTPPAGAPCVARD